jgi:two-component system NtrC family sensor kinase
MRIRYVSLRTKLIASFLAVILLGGVLSLSFGTQLVEKTIISQAQDKVKYDQQTAWIIYNDKLNFITQTLVLTARRESLQAAVLDGDKETIGSYLKRIKNDYGLDILSLLDPEGKVTLRIGKETLPEGDKLEDPIVAKALLGETSNGSTILSRKELQREDPELARRADIKVIPTPKSSARSEAPGGSGLMLMAAAPILQPDSRVLGILYGGVLLNRNYEIVDRVKEAVYKEEKYKGADIGTATIFLKNLRISTNVMDRSGKRAIGTLLSEEVRKIVLEDGRPWIGRAFVVNDWYITSYEPIRNIEGKIIGILYVGMLEKPYIDAKNRVMLTFTGIACLCVVLLLIILFFSTSRIIKPLKKMVEATEKISGGDLSHKVQIQSRDEIGYLGVSFNRMTENLREANEKLVEYGRTLEKKVEERTKELRDMQYHLIQSEKLASLGKLSASIAHEINNPLGGILIYAHLILEDMKEEDPAGDNIRKIIKETTRCKNIVKDLLEFARPKEPRLDVINVNEVLDRALGLVIKQAEFQNIRILKSLSADLPSITADGDQIQQVLLNIILNACEAMEGKGDLTLKTRADPADGTIVIEITDTGCGMSEEIRSRLFEPFFTTKEVGKGTGLGLAVSYGIITKHRGTITVESQKGKGSTFNIRLPKGA